MLPPPHPRPHWFGGKVGLGRCSVGELQCSVSCDVRGRGNLSLVLWSRDSRRRMTSPEASSTSRVRLETISRNWNIYSWLRQKKMDTVICSPKGGVHSLSGKQSGSIYLKIHMLSPKACIILRESRCLLYGYLHWQNPGNNFHAHQ